jgi:hypothetical protein
MGGRMEQEAATGMAFAASTGAGARVAINKGPAGNRLVSKDFNR